MQVLTPRLSLAAFFERVAHAPGRLLMLDYDGTLVPIAETPDWGPSWADLVASVGYELPDEVRDRWWHDALDGTEHDEHSQSRDHYVAWQRARTQGMLDECGVPRDTHDVLIARVREMGATTCTVGPSAAGLRGTKDDFIDWIKRFADEVLTNA